MAYKDVQKRRKRSREYVAERYKNDPEFRKRSLQNSATTQANYRAWFKQVVEGFKANGCALCDEAEPCCLSAHHVDPSEKDFNISQARTRKLAKARVLAELEKCVCLCENCHRKVHAGILEIPKGRA